MTKKQILQAIRDTCIDCMAGQLGEIRICTCEKTCPLWPFRMGTDPEPNKTKSEATKKRFWGKIEAEIL